MNKPVKPLHHGIIDYIFSAAQLIAPGCLALNKKIIATYAALGAGFVAINALTDTPAGIRKKLTFRQHQKADAGFLAGLGLLSAAGFIRRDKKALAFHLGFLALAVAHYALTDYKARK